MKTTRELAREERHTQIVQSLQELLVKNYDANKGFKKAVKEVKSQDLKDYLKIQALLHHRNATQLDKLIRSLNAKPLEEGSTVGRFHRIWMDVIKTFSGNDDQIILQECIRGQSATLKEYKDHIKKQAFSSEIKNVLKNHFLELEKTLAAVRSLEQAL